MKAFHHLILCGVLILAGCAGVSLGTPRIWQERQVTTLHSGRLLVLEEPLNRSAHERGGLDRYDFQLPAGSYRLEAEDDEYLYFEGASKIAVVTQKAGQPQDSRNLDGGIFMAKQGTSTQYSGGAFIDWDGGKKLLLVAFDSDFLGAEGRFWHYQN